jgi:hypothetical protein
MFWKRLESGLLDRRGNAPTASSPEWPERANLYGQEISSSSGATKRSAGDEIIKVRQRARLG